MLAQIGQHAPGKWLTDITMQFSGTSGVCVCVCVFVTFLLEVLIHSPGGVTGWQPGVERGGH